MEVILSDGLRGVTRIYVYWRLLLIVYVGNIFKFRVFGSEWEPHLQIGGSMEQ